VGRAREERGSSIPRPAASWVWQRIQWAWAVAPQTNRKLGIWNFWHLEPGWDLEHRYQWCSLAPSRLGCVSVVMHGTPVV
jgi:hypothetical protein